MKERCRETLQRAYLFLDGEALSDRERIEIQTHLEECEPCFERYGVDKEVTALIARRLSVTVTCPDELKSRISQLLHDA
ncbi:MAG TPA: zf-HC2 domain-containing protein [Actinomycetota bacterium]|nr:zf-HC2 domain-containing protein [Actinomycetota bacterium]